MSGLETSYAMERRHEVEKRIAALRIFGVAVATLLYVFVMNRGTTIPAIAWPAIAVAWMYGPVLVLVQRSGGIPRLAWSYLASAMDGLLLMAWVIATGGVHSDFFVLMYGCVIAVAFQYGPRQATVATFLYSAAYVAMAAALGQLADSWMQVSVRVGAAFFIAPLGGMVAREAIEQGRAKIEMREMALATKAAEEGLRKSLALLRESEERFRKAFQGNLDALSVNEYATGKYREVNDEWLALTGYTPEEVLGKTPAEIGIWADPEEFRLVLRELKTRGIVRNHQSRFRMKDGHVGWGLFSAIVMDFGKERCVLSFVRDVTDLKRAEKEVEESRRAVAVSEKLSALGTLVSGVAHEIRTPSTYVANNVFLLRVRLEEAARKHPELQPLLQETLDYCSGALEGMERINRLVQNLRRFARSDNQGRVEVGLHEVTKEALELFEATQRGRIRIVSDLQTTPPIALDREQFEQVVLNLLNNAADAMPSGGTIHVATRSSVAEAEIEIRDEGQGIRPEIQSRLFDPFFTTKDEGTGLGLSIARRIVDAHGGTIGYRTELGVGTTFVVSLPVHDDSQLGENA